MTKTYNYIVGNVEFTDTKCFDKAWNDARELAKETHKAVYRMIRKDGEDTTLEVYLKGGCFLPVSIVTEDRINIF